MFVHQRTVNAYQPLLPQWSPVNTFGHMMLHLVPLFLSSFTSDGHPHMESSSALGTSDLTLQLESCVPFLFLSSDAFGLAVLPSIDLNKPHCPLLCPHPSSSPRFTPGSYLAFLLCWGLPRLPVHFLYLYFPCLPTQWDLLLTISTSV